ncbi:MAG: pyrimidine 5'-nucleotidase [Anaerolineales bacterium]
MNSPLQVLFIDLDDTLYPKDSGIWQAISDRINRYMVERIGLSQTQANSNRTRYLEAFGTSLTGLVREHHVSPQEYLQFVHDIPIDEYLSPAPAIRSMLDSLPQEKFVFTNASEAHAQRVLQVLDISECFEAVIGIEALGMVSKPAPGAYTKALQIAGGPAPDRCALVDDRLANLEPAAGLAMLTVWVSVAADQPDFVDQRIASIASLSEAINAATPSRSSHG